MTSNDIFILYLGSDGYIYSALIINQTKVSQEAGSKANIGFYMHSKNCWVENNPIWVILVTQQAGLLFYGLKLLHC